MFFEACENDKKVHDGMGQFSGNAQHMHKHKNWVDYTSDKVQGGLVVLDVMAFPSVDTSKEKEASKSGVGSTMSDSLTSTLLVLCKQCLMFLVHLGKKQDL